MTAPRGGSVTLVRAAVAGYLSAGAVPNLATVYQSPPFDESSIPWDQLLPAGGTVRCFGVVFIDSDADEVIAFDGAGGRRVCTYQVAVELFFQDVGGDAIAAQSNLDAVVDGVKQRLRTDPALGTDQSVSQIIQAGVTQLDVQRGRPERLGDGDTFGAWVGIRFTVQTYEYAS